MPSTLSFIAFLISDIFISSSFLSLHAKPSKSVGFSTRLINVHSIHSPYYNSKLTRSDRIQAAVHHSYSRQNHIQAVLSNNIAFPTDIATTARPESNEYMMEYYIGKPVPVRSYGIIDTGSDLFWLQCLPCEKCFKQPTPYFDPLNSTSYVPLTCDEPLCRKLRGSKCSDLNLCLYESVYGDGSYSMGSIAYETVLFRDHNVEVGNYTWDFVVFGCGHYNYDPTNTDAPGIIGLNRSPISLIQQFVSNKQFAYCFGDPLDVHADGYIKFGEAAPLHGKQTPMMFLGGKYNMYYYLKVEGISIDDTRLMLPEETFTFKSSKGTGGFLVDSGAAYTMLNATAFTMLVEELDHRLDKKHYAQDEALKVCYSGEASDFVEGPHITFHFSGADLKLTTWSTWVIDDDTYCLGIIPTEGTSILGNYQQQNIEIGFDLQNNVIYFNSMSSCSTLGL